MNVLLTELIFHLILVFSASLRTYSFQKSDILYAFTSSSLFSRMACPALYIHATL